MVTFLLCLVVSFTWYGNIDAYTGTNPTVPNPQLVQKLVDLETKLETKTDVLTIALSKLNKDFTELQKDFNYLRNENEELKVEVLRMQSCCGQSSQPVQPTSKVPSMMYNDTSIQFELQDLRHELEAIKKTKQGRCVVHAQNSIYRYSAIRSAAVVFNFISINEGLCFNGKKFIASIDGHYFFSWTVYSYEDERISPEVRHNGNVIGKLYASGSYDAGISLSLVVSLNQGDVIWLESPSNSILYGNKFSAFSAFFLF